jgi:hypothetical protein
VQQKKKTGAHETDGVMVVTCKHCFVYYYHVLLRHESVRDVFTFLVTRFEHRPPRFIIYDNACELSRYCEGVSEKELLPGSEIVACRGGACFARLKG